VRDGRQEGVLESVGFPQSSRCFSEVLDLFRAPLRRLEWPLLPVPVSLALGNPVGAGAGGRNRNRQADVLAVQDRLHQLAVLPTDDYLREQRIVQGLATLASAQMPETMRAILKFQNTAGGGIGRADQIISANGHTERILKDPTYGTRVPTNPDTDNDHAGPGQPAAWHGTATHHNQIVAIILAIEEQEGAGSVGEVPAIRRNGSQTPASFGKAQLVGGTAVGTVAGDANIVDFYDLDAARTGALDAVSLAVNREFDRLFAAIPAGALTEANLAAAIATDSAANLVAFQAGTEFGPDDHEFMVRTARFRHQCLDFVAARGNRANAVAAIAAFMALADVAANIAALSLKQDDVRAFLNSLIDNEHRNGFITRALFRSEHGLRLKNAMTDNSGFKIGRFLIRDTYNMVLARIPGATANDRERRARVTARAHNEGTGGIPGWVANPATSVSEYTDGNPARGILGVMDRWVDNP